MKAAFSSLIAIILFAIYVFLVWHAVDVSYCVTPSECQDPNRFTSHMASSLTLIGGLVSALVIAELAVTKAGEAPAARLLDADPSGRWKRIFQLITGLYLFVWLATGLAAYIIGYLLHEDKKTVTTLTDLGQSWFGIAVGAGYAYFGIKQP